MSFNRSSQYLVSCASLYAIETFDDKSLRDIAALASLRLAPIEVPDLSSCLDKTYSFLIVVRC